MKRLSKFLVESIEKIPNAFVILKPEFLNNELEWKNMLRQNGWSILKSEKKTLSLDEAKELYKPHKGKDFYKDLCKYMSSGPCIVASCYKDSNDPIKEMDSLKDKVREKWGKDDMKNAMHSSDSLENVKRETDIVL